MGQKGILAFANLLAGTGQIEYFVKLFEIREVVW